MRRRPPRATRTDTLFPTRGSSDRQAHVQGVLRRSSFAANGTLLDPAVEHAAVLVGIVHHRKVAAADQVGAAVEHTAVPVEQDAGLETEVPVVSAQRLE